jgi:3-deoxy-D-manno-octulosonic-acid transferase/heptosyltransferase-1
MKILIVKLSAIGDVVHALPTLNALHRLYPEAQIDWLVEEPPCDLLIDHPYLTQVLVCKRTTWLKRLQQGVDLGKTLKELRTLTSKLRSEHYDLVIDLQGLLKSSVWVFLTKGKRKIGYNGMREGSRLFVHERIDPPGGELHAVDRYLRVAEYLGAPAEPPHFPLHCTERDKDRAVGLAASAGLDLAYPLVLVHASARWKTKRPEDRKMAEICDRLVSNRMQILCVGSDEDRAHVEAIRSLMRERASSVAGETTLRELASLCRLANCVVSTDSAPLHIAVAVGTSVTALFGPTSPVRTGPYGKNSRVVQKRLGCSPCFKKTCETMECMQSIETDEVVEAVREVLSHRKGDEPSEHMLETASLRSQ